MSFPWAKPYQPTNGVTRFLDQHLPLPRLLFGSIGAGYPVPRNLNYFYNFGVLAGLALVLQMGTGIILAMHYADNSSLAFGSIEHIMRDVNWGWLFRYMHANGASLFFIVVYVHIFRGLYYGSYKAPRETVWVLGLVILLLMIATAFMGYVLPWGQMSFWGAKVITSLFGAIPWVGETVQIWLLGGYAPDDAALNRFFALHYLFPFLIVGVVILKIWSLHLSGSSNPTGVEVLSSSDTIDFHPYYTAKDSVSMCVFLMVYFGVVFFAPNYMGHADNYIEAQPLSTPALIVPEWYFWPFYAILRAFTTDVILPAKLWGVIGMFSAILILFFLPFLDRSPIRSANYRPMYRIAFWVLVCDVLVLGYVGGSHAVEPYIMISQAATFYYFAHFLIVLPLITRFEKPLPLPKSITEAVLPKTAGATRAKELMA